MKAKKENGSGSLEPEEEPVVPVAPCSHEGASTGAGTRARNWAKQPGLR